jgi:hypothetical protein
MTRNVAPYSGPFALAALEPLHPVVETHHRDRPVGMGKRKRVDEEYFRLYRIARYCLEQSLHRKFFVPPIVDELDPGDEPSSV